MSFVFSPILHVTPFVGKLTSKIQAGKPWLWNDEYGFSFCVGEIHTCFGPLPFGEIVRVEASTGPFKNAVEYSVHDACGISKMADRMLSQLFG